MGLLTPWCTIRPKIVSCAGSATHPSFSLLARLCALDLWTVAYEQRAEAAPGSYTATVEGRGRVVVVGGRNEKFAEA